MVKIYSLLAALQVIFRLLAGPHCEDVAICSVESGLAGVCVSGCAQ